MNATKKLWRGVRERVADWVNVLDEDERKPTDPLRAGLAELRAALEAAAAALAQALVAERQLGQQLAAVQSQWDAHATEAERAVLANGEKAARTALRRQTELEPRLNSLKQLHASALRGCEAMRSRLHELQSQYEELSSSAAVMTARERAARAAASFNEADARSAAEDAAAVVQRRIDEAQAMADVLTDAAKHRDRWSDLEQRLEALQS